MTKRQALQECINLWIWLAEHPKAGKGDYPRIGLKAFKVFECPCCTYAQRKFCEYGSWVGCDRCPLRGYAWQGTCGHLLSPYKAWLEARREPTASRRAALRMVRAAKKALADLNKPRRKSS